MESNQSAAERMIEDESDLFQIVADIAAGGAIMRDAEAPASYFLVGALTWLESGRIFWFTAYGDRPSDGHLLVFDHAQLDGRASVSFSHRGRMIGHLSTIATAPVDDPDDFEIAWRLWQQVAPLRQRQIEECLDEIACADGDVNSQGVRRASTSDLFAGPVAPR